jgi:hypothetical protein
MERWGMINHPLVKAVAGSSIPLFLALNFPTIFLIILVCILFYAITLLGVMHTYRRQYRIVGRPELALQLASRTTSNLKEACHRMVTRGLERRQRRKSLQQERKAKLSQYRRERNRRKRQQAREVFPQQ